MARTRVRATDDVAEKVGRLIAANQMGAGDPLPSEQALGDMYGVSKRVVREALRALAAQGVVRTSQGKRAVVGGTSPIAIEAYFRFVQRMDRDSVGELFELREVIEVGASGLAARRATEVDTSRARQAVEEMVAAGDDVEAYIAGDLAFHVAIIEGAHNRFLTAVMSALSGALHVEREVGVRSRIEAGRHPHAVREHRAVLKAVEAGDQQRAERAMIAHMLSGRADLENYLSEGRVAVGGSPAKWARQRGYAPARQRGDKRRPVGG